MVKLGQLVPLKIASTSSDQTENLHQHDPGSSQIMDFTGSHFKTSSHFQDGFQLLQFGLLLLYFAVIVLSQICQQLPCDVQHLLLDKFRVTQRKEVRTQIAGTEEKAVTVTCSCFGFFSFSFPVLYPPYFSNRSKNLNKVDKYKICTLHAWKQWFNLCCIN